MNKTQNALKLALEALEASKRTHHYCEDTWYSCPKHEEGCANESEGDECNCGADEANAQLDKAITAIREALAETKAQQPVSVTDELVNAYCMAWEQSFMADNPYHTVSMSQQDKKHIEAGLKAALVEQPAQQEELQRLRALVRAQQITIKKLEAQQEPIYHLRQFGDVTKEQFDRYVATGDINQQPAQQHDPAFYRHEDGHLMTPDRAKFLGFDLSDLQPLYTSPPASKPWVGLTEFDIDQIPYSCSHADSRLIAYAIEAKLKEKNK